MDCLESRNYNRYLFWETKSYTVWYSRSEISLAWYFLPMLILLSNAVFVDANVILVLAGTPLSGHHPMLVKTRTTRPSGWLKAKSITPNRGPSLFSMALKNAGQTWSLKFLANASSEERICFVSSADSGYSTSGTTLVPSILNRAKMYLYRY